MDVLLAPGMRLIRRLGVTGKFVTIGLLLLVPLLVSAVAGWSAGSREITFTIRERQGLRLVVPVVRLVAVLADTSTDLAAEQPSPAVRSAVAEVDAVDAAVGTPLGLHRAWLHLRGQVLTDPRDAVGPAPDRLAAVDDFLERTADASNLILDPQLDSYYVMIALVERLPDLLTEAATDERRARAHADPPDPQQARNLTAIHQRLRVDLATAGSSTDVEGLAAGYSGAASALSAALDQYVRDLSSGAVHDLSTVSASSAALATALGGTLDSLLARRGHAASDRRARPALLAGLAMIGAGYLALALYRATSQDVHAVLRDVRAVISGDLQTGEPLPGQDEFAQMSRAIREANDRLTELLSALRMQATHDELTALPNRTMFMSKVREAIEELPGRFAVVLVDLERFKDVNDSFGHDIGDRLLKAVSVRFHRAAGRRNLVARLGGDEFAVLVRDSPGEPAARHVVARLQAALAEPVDVDGRRLHVRARIGITLHATGRPGARELVRNADVALSAAKAGESSAVSLFEPAMHDRTRDRTELSADLVTALAQHQLSLVYQPVVDVSSGVVHGVEALARWTHPTRGEISPTVFVPLAEASGQIVPLGRWVLHEALRQLAHWHRTFPDGYPLTLDVNLSADQLADPALPGEVLALIDQTGVDPRRLVLEITESALIRDTETVLARLRRLSVLGIRLALDDFGTGYSSLSYLRRMPVSVLKIDKSFVDGIDQPDGQAARLLGDIVGLGAGLGMEVIAEGIESPGQVPVLREAGCHLGQGFLWSRPLPADGVEDLLRRGGRIVVSGSDGAPSGSGSRSGSAPGTRAEAIPHPRGERAG